MSENKKSPLHPVFRGIAALIGVLAVVVLALNPPSDGAGIGIQVFLIIFMFFVAATGKTSFYS